MAEDWVEASVRDLTRWAGERDEDLNVDVDGARLLLELAADELELTALAQLSAARLRALLLDVFPEVVVAGPDDVPGVLATARTIVDFLDEAGMVPPDAVKELRLELDRLAPEFTELIAATDAADREVAADVLARMMRDDSVDVTDEAEVERWIKDFESLPEEERFARTARYLPEADDTTMPPVRPTPLDEVVGAARASGLIEQASALADWVGERHVPGGRLTAADALAAVADLELTTPRWDGARTADARDIPELERLWRAAIAAGLVTVAADFAGPGPGLATVRGGDTADTADTANAADTAETAETAETADPSDTAVLNVWLRAFDAAVTAHGADIAGRRLTPFEVVRRELPGVLIQLYEQEEPSTSAELFDALMEHVVVAYEVGDEELWQTVGDYALTLDLEELAEWGVLAGTEDGYELTPLGVWGVRQLLLADGYTAPLVGELADGSAGELVSGLAWHRAATADEEIELWLARRPAETAAGELVGVMAGGSASARNLAAAVLHRVGPAAEQVVRAALDEPVTRPYAALWLAQHGDTSVAPGSGEILWIFADTVAGMLETTDPAEAVAAAVADTPADLDLRATIEEMWRIDHPDVADVLRALGEHHPDKEVAKAARKAAFKARSRANAP